MRIGTSYFVSFDKACDYYRTYEETSSAAVASVVSKIAEGSIHIGKPALKPGERLLVIDNGTRYAIEEA